MAEKKKKAPTPEYLMKMEIAKGKWK